MGGATVPVPGGGVGNMAFPSAAEPNPILKGLRGQGPETIINQIAPPQSPTQAPPQAPAATQPPANQINPNADYLFYDPTKQTLVALQGGLAAAMPGWGQGTSFYGPNAAPNQFMQQNFGSYPILPQGLLSPYQPPANLQPGVMNNYSNLSNYDPTSQSLANFQKSYQGSPFQVGYGGPYGVPKLPGS